MTVSCTDLSPGNKVSNIALLLFTANEYLDQQLIMYKLSEQSSISFVYKTKETGKSPLNQVTKQILSHEQTSLVKHGTWIESLKIWECRILT